MKLNLLGGFIELSFYAPLKKLLSYIYYGEKEEKLVEVFPQKLNLVVRGWGSKLNRDDIY